MDDLRTLSDAAEPGPWEYRPCKNDDWGMIRGSREAFPEGGGGGGAPVALAEPRRHDYDYYEHHTAGTDPMEANGAFIVAVVNAYREGRLVEISGESDRG